MSALYCLSDIGESGLLVSGWTEVALLVQVGKFYLPAESGIGESGLQVSGYDAVNASLRAVQFGTLRIEDTGLQDAPTASFTISADSATAPQDGDPVIIALGTLDDPIFGGYLVNPKLTKRTATTQHYACTATGWARDLQKRLISGVWQGVYADAIVAALIAAYTPYFRCAAHVTQGVYLEEYRAVDLALLDICNALAAQCGYVFFVDARREVHFEAAGTLTAPWAITSAERFDELEISTDSRALCNHVIVHYSDLLEFTEAFAGDGTTAEWALARVPYRVTSVNVNGVAVTFGARYAEDNAANDFSIDYTSGRLHTSAHATLTVGQTVSVGYTGRIPARLELTHRPSQLDRQAKEGGDGLYDQVITDREIVSLADARARATAIVTADAWPKLTASYTRTEYFYEFAASRVQVGQQQTLNYWGLADTLTVERVTLSVRRPAADQNLKFEQRVELGPVARGVEQALKDLTQPDADTAAGDTEIITIEEITP